jgi:exopolyphosphatase/guanosine-5'-triphosphate,3'-diphosphate pyrophosphatase
MLLAGVDIGTLTCRLLIAEVGAEGRLLERQSDRQILTLGEGVDRGRHLHPDAMARVIAVLKEWRKLIDAAHVDGEIAVATSAVREADNREAFLSQVKEATGFSVEVITGDEEARRTLLGVRSGLPAEVSEIFAVDIGGGSTEFIVDRREGNPVTRSIKLGVVRLTERAFHHDPPAAEEIQAARDLVRSGIRTVRSELGDLKGLTCVGTAGSVTTLAAMAQRLPTYQPARIHNYRLTLEAVAGLEGDMLKRSKHQRRDWPGLERGREEVIPAGALILREILETLQYRECLVSDYGLREGVVIDLASRLR